MGRLILVGTILFIAGCATKPEPKITTQEVKLPSFQCPKKLTEKNQFSRPTLYIEKINKQKYTNSGEIAKAYKISIKQLQQYAETLETYINGISTTCKNLENKSDQINTLQPKQ